MSEIGTPEVSEIELCGGMVVRCDPHGNQSDRPKVYVVKNVRKRKSGLSFVLSRTAHDGVGGSKLTEELSMTLRGTKVPSDWEVIE